jgi:glutamate-1-semialdehyde 2,1-aminomutase
MAKVYGQTAFEQYLRANPASKALHDAARGLLPGGITRTSVYFDPFPPYMERGEGCRIWDVDGNARIDFSNNYTALILGHCPPPVVAAVERQVRAGSAFAAPTRHEVDLAAAIRRRVPSVERLRFASSGTEAVMFAIRLARAFTGRETIAKAEGGFHGTSEYAAVSVSPDVDAAGDPRAPRAVPAASGLPAAVAQSVAVFPFNDLEATRQVLERRRADLAAVIIEPVMGSSGMIPARPDYLRALRDLTARNGVLLILDEIITLRLSSGGAQRLYDVTPDLTVMGKIIGGGYPVAAFGGRADVMALLDPEGGRPAIPQSGTFNGNPIGMVAGLATLEQLRPQDYDRLNALGDDLRARLRALFARKGIAAQVTGLGSLLNLHFTAAEVTDFRSMRTGDAARLRAVFFGLLNAGIYLAPRGMACLSTPMGEAEVAAFVRAAERALEA